MSKKKSGLGQGIQALFQEVEYKETPTQEERVTEISLAEIRPNPYQPRRQFEEDALQ